MVNGFLYKFIISFLFIIISLIFLVFTFSIRLRLLKKIFLKIFSSSFLIFIKTSKVIKSPLEKKNYTKTSKIKSKNEPTILKNTKVLKSKITRNKTGTGIMAFENEFIFNLPTNDLLIK